MLCISVPGCAGMIPFFMGASYELKARLEAQFPKAPMVYAGLSAGSVGALFLSLPFDREKAYEYLSTFEDFFQSSSPLHHYLNWYQNSELFLRRLAKKENILPEFLTNRLYIRSSIIKAPFPKSHIFHHFKTFEEVIKAIMTSAHLFPFRLRPLKRYQKKWFYDGGLTGNTIALEGYRTFSIPIQAALKYGNLSDFMVSPCKKKLKRLWNAGRNYTKEIPNIENLEVKPALIPWPTRKHNCKIHSCTCVDYK